MSNISLLSIMLTILLSFLVNFIYGLVLAHREEQIRNYINNKGEGWVRRKYIKALLGAVRGQVLVRNARNLAVLILLIPLSAHILLLLLGNHFESLTLKANADIQSMKDRLELPDKKSEHAEETSKLSTEKRLETMRKRIKEIEDRQNIINKGNHLIVFVTVHDKKGNPLKNEV